jgi:large subunit ribosomal protein L13
MTAKGTRFPRSAPPTRTLPRLPESGPDGYCLGFGAAVFARLPLSDLRVLPVRTYSPKASEITRDWHVIDAEGAILGRLATEIATLLRGKHKPMWVPHMDVGDHVVIVNASKLAVGPRKLVQKKYHRHSGYPGGISTESLEHLLARDPEKVIKLAVRRMLPKGPLGRQMLRKLKVYGGPTHPHQAQRPTVRPLPERSKARVG